MALTFRIRTNIEITDANGRFVAAPLGQSYASPCATITASTGEVHDQTHVVSTESAVKLFDVSEDLSSFAAMAVVSDVAGLLQLVNNSAGNFFTIEMQAGVPAVLGGDAGQYGGSVGAFDGTNDNIEVVYFYNSSSTVSASVRVLAVV